MTFKKKYAPLSSAKTVVGDRLVMAAAGRVRPSAGPAGRRERQLYEDSFVKPSLIAASRTPHEDGYRGVSAFSGLRSEPKVGV